MRAQRGVFCFNSTTVQLIRYINSRILSIFSKFQFHNGTINTVHAGGLYLFFLVFQFHNGTINTIRSFFRHTLRTGFNSTTVQLILRVFTEFLSRTLFQFHNGTINTIQDSHEMYYAQGFNSTTVQLIL